MEWKATIKMNIYPVVLGITMKMEVKIIVIRIGTLDILKIGVMKILMKIIVKMMMK